MDILEKLFGSSARIKILRLFLLNSGKVFQNSDVVQKSRVTNTVARRELAMLSKIGFINKKSFFRETASKTKNGKPKKTRMFGWQLSQEFPLLRPVYDLLITTEPLGRYYIAERIKKCGSIKLIIVSGIFMQSSDSRVDMLIVGDNLKKGVIESTVRLIESEVGKDVSYAFLETPEFKYRLSVFDKFVRDILDYPHIKILDKIGI